MHLESAYGSIISRPVAVIYHSPQAMDPALPNIRVFSLASNLAKRHWKGGHLQGWEASDADVVSCH